MQQENDKSSAENLTADLEKHSDQESDNSDLSALADSENADNLPIESIGSYGRIDDLLKGEGTEKQGRTDAEI